MTYAQHNNKIQNHTDTMILVSNQLITFSNSSTNGLTTDVNATSK